MPRWMKDSMWSFVNPPAAVLKSQWTEAGRTVVVRSNSPTLPWWYMALWWFLSYVLPDLLTVLCAISFPFLPSSFFSSPGLPSSFFFSSPGLPASFLPASGWRLATAPCWAGCPGRLLGGWRPCWPFIGRCCSCWPKPCWLGSCSSCCPCP